MKRTYSIALIFIIGFLSGCSVFSTKTVTLEDSVKKLREACLAKNNEACSIIGAISFKQRKNDLAKKFLTSPCEGHDKYSCHLLGLIEKGSPSKASTYFEKGCNLGLQESCTEFEIIRYNSEKRAQSPPDMLEQCNKGVPLFCTMMAYNLRVYGDLKESGRYFKMACDASDAAACYELGYIELILNNKKSAISNFKKSCEKKYSLACNKLK